MALGKESNGNNRPYIPLMEERVSVCILGNI